MIGGAAGEMGLLLVGDTCFDGGIKRMGNQPKHGHPNPLSTAVRT